MEELSKESLLSKCLHGQTQNQNESFNGMIWNRVPKGTYVGFRQFDIGVRDAVSHFNVGNAATILTYEKLGMDPGHYTYTGCSDGNLDRVRNAGRQSEERKKTRRRFLRGKRKQKTDKTNEKEGETYRAGGF